MFSHVLADKRNKSVEN